MWQSGSSVYVDNRTGQSDAPAAVGGALVVGALAGFSGGGGLALVAGLTGVAGMVTFLGGAMIVSSLAVLLTIMEGIRKQEASRDEEPAWRG